MGGQPPFLFWSVQPSHIKPPLDDKFLIYLDLFVVNVYDKWLMSVIPRINHLRVV